MISIFLILSLNMKAFNVFHFERSSIFILVLVFAVAEHGTGNADETDDGSNNDPWKITGFGNLESSFSEFALSLHLIFFDEGLISFLGSGWAYGSNLGFPVFDLVTVEGFL